jgi:hypothetical protein
VNVKIYVEGGGDSQKLRTECRRAFSQFFERAGFKGRMPAIVACGSRENAYDSFCTALAEAAEDDFPLLLVDSEAAVTRAPWPHLKTRDNWDKPPDAVDAQAQLMVQCMETWFLADREALAKFYGQGFHAKSLPANANIEEIEKAKVFSSLKEATRQTKKKGAYSKGSQAFALLAKIAPATVIKASKHAKRLIDTLQATLG